MRPTGNEMHISFGSAKLLSNELGRLQGERVHHIAGFLLQVGADQRFQNAWMRAFRVVVKEEVFVGHRGIIASKNSAPFVPFSGSLLSLRCLKLDRNLSKHLFFV